MLRRINVVERTETKIFDMLRRIKDEIVKDPFQDMLRRINEVESKKKKNIFDMLRRIKDDKVKDPFQDMLRRINEVERKTKTLKYLIR